MKSPFSRIFFTLLVFGAAIQASAADSAFVGMLALLVEPEVAEQLELSEEVKEKLATLIADREEEALQVALKNRTLPPAEQKAKMAPFVAETEKQGFALLTEEQHKKLLAIRVARKGMASLIEPKIAEAVGLSEEQQQEIGEIMKARGEELTRGGSDERARTEAEYERKLAAVLSKTQRTAWEIEAGLLDPDAPVAVKTDDPPTDPTDNTPATDPADSAQVAGGEKDPKATTVKETPAGNGKIKFSSRFSPWADTLEWFADQADLALVADNVPPGTFNYTDPQEYTPDEALDLINGVLQTKGYILVRKQRMLFLINLEDEIPPTLIETISPEELDGRGRHALVRVAFQLDKMTAEQAEDELRPLIGGKGDLKVLPSARQVIVVETADKLRMIRAAINAVEAPPEAPEQVVKIFTPKHSSAEEVLAVVRGLLAFPDAEANALPDGSLRFSTDPLSGRIFVSATPEQLKKFEEVFKLTDVDTGGVIGEGAIEVPSLQVYPISTADPTMALQVVQTLMVGELDVRVALDEQTGSVIVFARPSQHALVKATIDKLQQDRRQIEVFQLRRVDPTLALLAVNSLFSIGGEEPNPSAPKVDADPTTAQMFIRGSESQISQIRELLEKMGEDLSDNAIEAAASSPYRWVPSGSSTDAALKQLEVIWPTIRKNRIRVVTPSSGEKTDDREPLPFGLPFSEGSRIHERQPLRDDDDEPVAPPADSETDGLPAELRDLFEPLLNPEGKSTRKINQPRFQFVAWQEPSDSNEKGEQAAEGTTSKPAEPAAKEEPAAEPPADKPSEEKPADADKTKEPAEILIYPGPGGLYIVSEDTEALDDFMALLSEMTADSGETGPDYFVYYLKYAQADVAASLLQQVIAGDGGGGGGDGGGLLGDLAGDMLGGAGGLLGGLMGGLGGGGGVTTTGAVQIVPDLRLNALIVQASPDDQDLVEQLLRIIDRKASPEENETRGKPRLIPVFNQTAQEVAAVVQQTFAENISQGNGSSNSRQPSPEDLIKALRGGRGGGGGASQVKQEPAKMTISVDAKSNTLIVRAPDVLFDDVKALVEQLDAIGAAESEYSYVYPLKGLSSETMESTLSSIIGEGLTTSSVNSSTATAATAGAAKAEASSPDAQREVRDRIERFNAFRRAIEQGGGGGGGGRPQGGGGRGPGGGGGGGGRTRGGR